MSSIEKAILANIKPSKTCLDDLSTLQVIAQNFDDIIKEVGVDEMWKAVLSNVTSQTRVAIVTWGVDRDFDTKSDVAKGIIDEAIKFVKVMQKYCNEAHSSPTEKTKGSTLVDILSLTFTVFVFGCLFSLFWRLGVFIKLYRVIAGRPIHYPPIDIPVPFF